MLLLIVKKYEIFPLEIPTLTNHYDVMGDYIRLFFWLKKKTVVVWLP